MLFIASYGSKEGTMSKPGSKGPFGFLKNWKEAIHRRQPGSLEEEGAEPLLFPERGAGAGGMDQGAGGPSHSQQSERNMLWRKSHYLVRLAKNLYFGILWGLTIFFLYQSMVTYSVPSMVQQTTDSPATLAETIIKSCLQYGERDIGSVAQSSHVIVLGRRSPKTADLVKKMLQANRGVILVAHPAIFEHLNLRDLGNELRDIKLKFVHIEGSCQESLLQEVFKTHRIAQLHILFDEFDFSPVEFHQDVSGIFRCLIHTFETIAKYHDTPIFIHATRGRFVPYYRVSPHYHLLSSDQKQSNQGTSSKESLENISLKHSGLDETILSRDNVPTKQPTLTQNHRINSCDPLYNYDYYHDVFMKSVSIYTTTYKNLYDLQVQNVIY